jgi:hypothetical protein
MHAKLKTKEGGKKRKKKHSNQTAQNLPFLELENSKHVSGFERLVLEE